MFSWCHIARVSLHLVNFVGSNDVNYTSTFDDADSVFAFFSLNQARAFLGNFLKYPDSLCPFKPQKLHDLLELLSFVLLPLFAFVQPPCNSSLCYLATVPPLSLEWPFARNGRKMHLLIVAAPFTPTSCESLDFQYVIAQSIKSGLPDFNSSSINLAYNGSLFVHAISMHSAQLVLVTSYLSITPTKSL